MPQQRKKVKSTETWGKTSNEVDDDKKKEKTKIQATNNGGELRKQIEKNKLNIWVWRFGFSFFVSDRFDLASVSPCSDIHRFMWTLWEFYANATGWWGLMRNGSSMPSGMKL